jgi:4-hydroxy-3-polyprenylbenzoate decarboxylase
MAYQCTADMLPDLERRRELLRFDEPIDTHLEISAVLRQVYQAQGPAVLFTRPSGSPFPIVGNLYGTLDRARFLLRHGMSRVEKAMHLKADPAALLRRPWHYAGLPLSLPHLLPRSSGAAPVLQCRTQLSTLPRHVSWPDDGGPFIMLPQVYTEHPDRPGWMSSNVGMYRVQLGGNEYVPDREAGLHYQLHRGIGVHHQAASRRGERLWVNVAVGGPPALTWAAVMPLPEGLPEVVFAGALSGRAVRLARAPESPLPVFADADFVLVGWIDPHATKPEGPFGDHLGYYSLAHPFPVLQVEAVYHRRNAVWPVTSVGRPPQEDTSFGAIIHELTGPVLPTVLPGVKQIHAVDEAGVHPLLLAIGSERYTPYQKRDRPQELLTAAHAILGQGQLSLAKYLLIVAQEDDSRLDCHDISAFLQHLLRRADWHRDLHFHTQTTIDTLDYSGGALNQGSKLVVAAVGDPIRELPTSFSGEGSLPVGFSDPRVALPGVVVLRGERAPEPLEELPLDHFLAGFPLWVVADSSSETAATLRNFLWTTFTRSNPAADVYGVGAETRQKHWGCRGPLIIDARAKHHHAPPLLEDPAVLEKVQRWAQRGGPLHGVL